MPVDSSDPIGYRLGGFLLVLLRLGPFSDMHFTLKLFFAFLIAGFTFPVSAEGARGTGLVLLLEPVGARAAAMAGALSSISDDQTTIYLNPSSVALLTKKDFVLTHHAAIAGVRQFQSGWAFGNGKAGVGLSLGFHTAGGFEARTGPTTDPIGTFNLFEFNSAFTYGQRIGSSLYGGFTARFLHEDLEADRSSGFGLDLGITYRAKDQPLAIAASILHLGRMDALDQVSSSLPREIRLGASYKYDRVLLSAEYRILRFGSSGALIGGEVRPAPMLSLRAGYQSGHDTRSLSYGLGLTRRNWRIDYAFIPSDLGFDDSHRVTVGIR